MNIANLIDDIARLPSDWHGAGTVGRDLLRRIAALAGSRTFRRTVETGAGRTTLLLSHLSERHTCFAVDSGRSVSAPKASQLLRSDVVEFVEGPTQMTLPRYRFDEPIELALLDGPHGFPFPQLEYWNIYPHLAPGGFLVVDDIHIPSVHMLFAFLRDDRMFRLRDVVEKTAVFERTDAPAVNPLGDAWQEQGYNTKRFPVRSGLPLIAKLKLAIPQRWVPSLQSALARWRTR